ncbi:hypothetical protein VKT23_017243 [Stygiomarasmius scandens]|uniref:Heterokaryon incompatibility domain-containing protein n=1 Tax=Marasmiellus scandens TaxID=2682957 RepID=A0ABR1ISG8_9AGAR
MVSTSLQFHPERADRKGNHIILYDTLARSSHDSNSTVPHLRSFASGDTTAVMPSETSSPHSHRWILVRKGGMISIPNPTSPALMENINRCPRRLIDTHSLKLVEFRENDTIPPYAILSHTWGKKGELIIWDRRSWYSDDEEVVYAEFIKPRKETFSKSGYRKIQGACQQACQDGIRYIWVDTCCIEQGNHEDVAANITSMHAYYQNAEICYAYLADIKEREDMFGDRDLWGFRTGWFGRGWTLQELLAPRTVVFFNKHWQRIGDKYNLRDDISHITTIPPIVLSGELSIQDVDVLTRMSWAVGRLTTKPQDEAYCLQGLLGVLVKPDYDESSYASFNRLGKALFDARPELKGRLGINDDLFKDPDSLSFYILIYDRYMGRSHHIANCSV